MAGPNDPPAVSGSEGNEFPARRRSSVAYDPARDTFKQIPETVSDDAIDDRSSQNLKSPPTVETQPFHTKTMSSPTDLRKRQRSTPTDTVDQQDDTHRHEEPAYKKRRPSVEERQSAETLLAADKNNKTEIKTIKDLPRISRVPRSANDESHPRTQPNGARSPISAYSRRPDGAHPRERENNGGYRERRRSRSPPLRRRDRERDVYRRRSPPRQQRRDPSRSPSPIRSPTRSGPIIRPGGAKGKGRNVLAEQQRLAAEREAKQAQQAGNHGRGVQDVSNQFYNARPEWVKEKGRSWRTNESKIKGLRVFNNWIKSCLIHKFSPEEKTIGQEEELGWGEQPKEPEETKPLLVLDVGCGKGGDLNKWQLAPQMVGLYVGLDPAAISIKQAIDRYKQMRSGRKPIFDARFVTQDCFGEWIGNVPIIREVGIDPNAGNGQIHRWGGGGGFDIVTMMFSMHYAFESEEKVRTMLRNVAGSLKKGGRFVGVVPDSDVLASNIRQWYANRPQSAQKPDQDGATNGEDAGAEAGQKEEGEADDNTPSWGNSIYNVRFPPQSNPAMVLNPDGTFRPPFGWKYTYWMAEAVDVPEFVVPWEAFRAIAEQFGLEQRYRRRFLDIWHAETEGKDPVARELSSLGVRMGVTQHEGGELLISEEEKEAVSFYHGFCFVKI